MEKRPAAAEILSQSEPAAWAELSSESFVPLAAPRVPVGPFVVSTEQPQDTLRCAAASGLPVCNAVSTASDQRGAVALIQAQDREGLHPEGLSPRRLSVHLLVENILLILPPSPPTPHPPSPSSFDYYLCDGEKQRSVLFFLGSPNSSWIS